MRPKEPRPDDSRAGPRDWRWQSKPKSKSRRRSATRNFISFLRKRFHLECPLYPKFFTIAFMLPTNPALIRRRLLGWFEKNKRDLPWRKTSDPYAIWISETMLQQTQVKTVVPYYEKFLKAFPTITALNRAPLRQVLRAWSGLGYYRRAENLKKSASELIHRHGGAMPQDYDNLRALPGIGDYTAGAILSIAFQKRYPAVDANARRVLGRFFDLAESKQLRIAAEQLVPRATPGNFNQAIMELGATICLPTEPLCLFCPLALHCRLGSGTGISKK